jgi:hypothetical protein
MVAAIGTGDAFTSPRLRIPGWKGRADSEEKREPASEIDTAEVDSLKVLDPEWPIREADIFPLIQTMPFVLTARRRRMRCIQCLKLLRCQCQ